MSELTVRGEYWIQDGQVDFADGDVGDQNHEMIASDFVFRQYEDSIISLAEEYEIEVEKSYGEYRQEDLTGAIDEIEEELRSKEFSQKQINDFMMKHLECNQDALAILQGGGDARLYAMKYENWIAVRHNNIELYGYDETKRKYLLSGILEILEDEGFSEDTPAENIIFGMHDFKTKRSNYLTLQDIENPIGMRTNQALQTTRIMTPQMNAASDENKGMFGNKSVKNKWTDAAQKAKIIGPGQDLWRGTSESISFSTWLKNNYMPPQ